MSTPPGPDEPARTRRGESALFAALLIVAAAVYAAVVWGFLHPGPRVGADYSYFFPRLLDAEWWRAQNGSLAVPWFTPSFCGGLPRIADGQDLTYALPQALLRWMDPLAAAYVTGVAVALGGGAGFGLLLRRAFGASLPVAALGAVVMAFNAAQEARTLAGHLAYHGMMLVPWACLGVTAPLPTERGARRWALLAHVILVGAALTYVVSAGMLNMAAPLGLAVVAVALAHALRSNDPGADLRDAGLRLGLGAALALALSAGKLAAFAGYYAHYRRDWYPLPGFAGVLETLSAAARAVYGWWAPAGLRVVNSRWTVEAHELTYGVGPLPAAGLIAGALGWARGRTSLGLTRGRAATLGALVTLVALPLAINVYTPGWNAFLKRLPVLSSSSLLIRWWLFYVFVAPLGLLGFERLGPRARAGVAAAGIAFTVALGLVKSRPDEAAGVYDPRSVVAAWHATRASGRPPPITSVTSVHARSPEDSGALVRGASQQLCYEPTFGYRLERFPRGPLHLGAVTDARGDALNLKNPACYVWPRENRCRPGDHFRLDQIEDLRRFAARRPFRFEVSARQRAADAVTVAAWLFVLASLTALAARRARRR